MGEIGALLGRVVAGKFAIEEHVGGGAMGQVFRARHVVLDTPIALKIMRADIAKDPMFKQRFYREAKAASRLDHPNSVRVLDFGVEPDGLVYLAMEFLDGRDLFSVLRDEWPFPDARIVDILVQTLGAVAKAHELGIVHRDLKPENIMVSVGAEDEGSRPYHVKVCDFGIAKTNDPRGFQSGGGQALTSSGTLIGTPEYMSPEQARGDPLDARSDLYSIGVVLYQLLVGKVPFTAENALGVVLKQVTDEPIAPSKVRPGVNARLEAICLRALKKGREDRYQTAKDMRRELRAVFSGGSPSIPDDSNAQLPFVDSERELEDGLANAATMVSPAATLENGRDSDRDNSNKTLRMEASPTQAAWGMRDDAELAARLSPIESADRLERTIPPVSQARRHFGTIVVIAGMGLLVGAGGVFWMQRRAIGVAQSSASSPSASATAAGDGRMSDAPLATVVASVGSTGEPSSALLLPMTAPLASARLTTKGEPIVAKHAGSVRTSGAVASTASPTASAAPSTAAAVVALVPAAPEAPAAVPTAAPTTYNAAGAFVALGALSHQRVREDVVRARMSSALPKLNECYRSALVMAGGPLAGSAEIHMSIDEKGDVTTIVNAPKHPAFARCAQGALGGQKVPVSALEGAASMGATATQWLTLHP